LPKNTLFELSLRPRFALASAVVAVGLGMTALHAFAPVAPATALPDLVMTVDPERQVAADLGTQETVAPRIEAVESLALAKRYDAQGYDWEAVIAGDSDVPRVAVKTLPKDLVHLQNVDLKKSLFFRTLLPMALQVNDEIEADRDRLLGLKAKRDAGEPLTSGETVWLARIAAKYESEPDSFEQLLRRVDGVPPSLVLAQAAEESGWGTSRFVREGNALFGQWTWSVDHRGIVPTERGDGETHKVRAFPSVKGAIAAYVHNLNTHPAYERFRLQRAVGASGYQLTATLDQYSERREKYVDTLRSIMSANRLAALDQAKLSEEIHLVSR
jgi:Bax protein